MDPREFCKTSPGRKLKSIRVIYSRAGLLNQGKSTCDANMNCKIKYFMRSHLVIHRVEKVYDFFVVELHKLCHDFEFGNKCAGFVCFLDSVLDSAEEVLDGAWDNADLILGYFHVES